MVVLFVGDDHDHEQGVVAEEPVVAGTRPAERRADRREHRTHGALIAVTAGAELGGTGEAGGHVIALGQVTTAGWERALRIAGVDAAGLRHEGAELAAPDLVADVHVGRHDTEMDGLIGQPIADATDEAVNACLAVGMDDCLFKPVYLEVLESQLNKLAETR